MNPRPTLHERAAFITDGGHRHLDLAQSAEVMLIAEVLAEASIWTDPGARLGDSVVDCVTDLASGPRRGRRRSVRLAAVAAAVVATLATAVAIVVRTEPDAEFDAQLQSTVSAPRASASASASAELYRNRSGFRVVLDARDLPSLPEGDYYQAWLKNDVGGLVPIGTFSSSQDEVTLWSGASAANFVRILVTTESTISAPEPSRVVLVGEVHHR
jgi:hypothetical protein